MASNKGFKSGKMLNGVDVQQIAQLPLTPAKELLAEKLGIAPYFDAQDPQKAPFINYVYENIMFAVEKGLPWNHVCLIVKFAHEFLKSLLVEHHKLPDAIKGFQKKSDILAPLSDRHKKQYTDFIYETVLCHYNLYKYVFSHLREVVKPTLAKDVVVPPLPDKLSKGQSVEVWEYQQKIKVIEGAQMEELAKLREKNEGLMENLPTHKTMVNLDEVPVPYSKMTLEELVSDVLRGFAESKKMELKCKADEMVQDLSFKIDKTVVPRPSVMGEPPRFKPKSPVHTRANTNNNSLKPDKDKASARSGRSRSGRASAASSKSKR